MVIMTKLFIALIFIAYFFIPPVLIIKVCNVLRITGHKQIAILIFMTFIYLVVMIGVSHYINIQINKHIHNINF